MKKFGFDRLRQDVENHFECEYSRAIAVARGDSEIERLLFAALWLKIGLRQSDLENLIGDADAEELNRWRGVKEARLWLFVMPQVQLEMGRVDFLFHAQTKDGSGYRQLIVECDGHEFHERTKVQASRDKARDRAAVLNGAQIFRFTGSEIWRDPMACADQIIEWALQDISE